MEGEVRWETLGVPAHGLYLRFGFYAVERRQVRVENDPLPTEKQNRCANPLLNRRPYTCLPFLG